MDIKEEIHSIISEEEKQLKNIFIKVIDETILFAKENNYNSVDTYIYVYDKVNELFGYVSNYYGYTSSDNCVLSYSFMSEIYDYFDYLSLEATKELRNKVLELFDIGQLGYFMDEFNQFKKIIDKFDERGLSSIYECVNIRRLVYDK